MMTRESIAEAVEYLVGLLDLLDGDLDLEAELDIGADDIGERGGGFVLVATGSFRTPVCAEGC